MKLIKGLILAILVTIALVIGILFSCRNSQSVTLDLLVYELPAMSLAVWVLLSFTLGAVLSAVVYGLINQSHRRRNTQLLRQVNQLQAQQSGQE